MVRIPEPRTQPSLIPLLQHVVAAGLTTTFAIAVVAGLSEQEAELLLAGEIEPTDEQREQLERLLSDYVRAIKAVNAETMKRGLAPTDLRPKPVQLCTPCALKPN